MTVAALAIIGVAIWWLRPAESHPRAPAMTTVQPAKPAPHISSEAAPTENSTASPEPRTTAPAAATAISSTAPIVVSTAANATFTAAAAPAVVPVVANQPTPSSQPTNVAPPDEITASARMYAAHASLRTPEESDPDSKANQQILQTMVLKALQRKDTAASALTASR